MKITCSRTRQLEIVASLYGPSKGSRAIYCLEKNPRSKIKGVGSSSQVVTNFIQPYLHQFFDNSHGLKGYGKPLKRPFDKCQLCLKAINIG